MDYPLLFSTIVDIGSNVPPGKTTGVSCVAFDNEEEILWTGNFSGHVTSFSPSSTSFALTKYTSFHVDYESDIRQITTCREGVFALTKDALRLSKRRGLPKFTHKSEHYKDLKCMLYKSGQANDLNSNGHLFMAGNQEKLIELDVDTLKHFRLLDIFEDGNGIKSCAYLKSHPRFICMADPDGKIVLRDTDHLKIQHQFNASAPISSLDACGNYLVTISPYSNLLMIYDLRQTKLVSLTQTYMPSHIKFLSRFTTKCCIVSRNGQFSIIDLMSPNTINPINTLNLNSYGAQVTAFDVSATDQAFAFGDDQNFLYVHSSCEKFDININRKQPEFATDILSMPPPYCPLMTDYYTPLSQISPFPYQFYSTMSDHYRLASYMTPKQCQRVYRPVPPISPELLRSMRVVGNIGYVVKPAGMITSLGNNYSSSGSGSIRNSPEGNVYGTDQMPTRYHFLEPNHNKVDKDEYNFSRYNNSPFPGLDSTVPNSYANNMIQCLYFISPVRSAIVKHICSREYCLVCELGFLFHMLDIAPHRNPCQANNFFRAFRTIPEVSAFKLILPEEESLRKQVNFLILTQQWLRFLLHQLHRECQINANNSKTLTQITTDSQQQADNSKDTFVTEHFSLQLTRNFECAKCKYTWKNPYISYPVTLNYPINHHHHHLLDSHHSSLIQSSNDNNNCNEGHGKSYVSFVDLLFSSIHTEQLIHGFCEKCQKLHNNITERRLVSGSLPSLLAINTGLDNEMAIDFWKTQIQNFTKTFDNMKNDKYVVKNLSDLEKKQSKQQKVASSNKPVKNQCRYGETCKKIPYCKFFHAHIEDEELSFNSWIPVSIFISKKTDTSLFTIKDHLSNWKNDSKSDYIEYSLINVTSVVKSSEDTFGNIVSAIKVDKTYLDARRKLLAKKMKRCQTRFANSSFNSSPSMAIDHVDSDSEDDSLEVTDDNEMFTVDSRNFCLEFEQTPAFNADVEWYLFNHYSISPITIEETVAIDLSWKVPTILMYIRKDFIENQDQNKQLRRVKNVINKSVFNKDLSTPRKLAINSISFYPLDFDRGETPKKSEIVAMDAEFVMLNHEETELRSDGTRSTIKPSHKSVARISCVRGSGPMQGVPFIDDYIATQDQVADYMTKFSGIQPGDLDVALSSKNLTTLKSTYLKLRFLVDNGVIFVGHGLRNDFRVINLVVPPEQVIDTVYLFQSPNSKRMVSLRFLAWHFLNLRIQSEAHDSIEDAKTALQLYHKYKELETNGSAKEAIENLYTIGKECGWKIPKY